MTIAGAVPRVISRAVSRAVSASLFGAVPRGTGADLLLYGEDDGLAFDFTNQSARIKDTTTLANNYKSTGIVAGGELVGPSGKLTYTSPSNKLTLQADGYYKYQAHNLILQSEDFATSWVATNTTVTANATAAPDGTTTADLIQHANTTSPSMRQDFTTVAGATYVFRLRVKSSVDGFLRFIVTDAGLVNLYGGWWNSATGSWATTAAAGSGYSVVGTPTSTAVGDGWYDISMTVTVGTSSTRLFLYLTDSDNTSTRSTTPALYFWGAHVYRYPANTDYIRTTSAAKYALPIEYDTSGNCLGLLVEEARTNVLPNNASVVIGGSDWATTSSSMDDTQNAAVSPTGETNAHLIYQIASSIADCYDGASGLTAASIVSCSCFFKAAGKQHAYIQVNGTTGGTLTASFVTVDLTTGTAGTITALANGGLDTPSVSVKDVGNGWYRLCLAGGIKASNTSAVMYIGGCDAQNSRNGTASGTDGVYVWAPQIEVGPFPTSPIITYGSAATRAADNISIATSAFPHSTTTGSVFANLEYKSPTTTGITRYTVSTGSAGRYIYRTGTNINVYDGTNASAFVSAAYSSDTDYKFSLAQGASTMSTATNGSIVASGAAYDDTMASGTLRFAFDGGTDYDSILLKKFSYVPRKKSEAEQTAETA